MTKERVYELTNEGWDIFNYYINENLAGGKAICSPLRQDKKPSFSVFKGTSGNFIFNDLATSESGNAIDFVMKLRGLDFASALKLIVKDLDLNDKRPTQDTLKDSHSKIPEYAVNSRPFTEADTKYWQQYGISMEVLLKYRVNSVKEYFAQNKKGKNYRRESSPDKPIFEYKNDFWSKIYKPLDEKKYRFQYLGFKTPDFIFGLEQLPLTGDLLFITGGEKDVLTLASHGYNAISLNSETASLNPKASKDLKQRFKKIIVLYDNDDTGLKQSKLLSATHQFFTLTLPEITEGGKDISDFFKTGQSIKDFQTLLEENCRSPEPFLESMHKSLFVSAEELLNSESVEPKYLWKPFFPKAGTGVLAGKPDTGKSQFARQFSLSIAEELDNFLGFPITGEHHKALYVATEDNEDATKYLVSKQTEGKQPEAFKNLNFLFCDSLETDEIISTLDQRLAEEPVDLVIVDSFGDIFQGNDSNNNMAMRMTVNKFNKLAQTHQCFILFVHHINKGAYKQAPSQESIQGGSGLVQKVRIAILISEGEGSTRYLSVVKGNYCPKKYKENSLELLFSEDSFLFKNTNRLIPTEEIGGQNKQQEKKEKDSAAIASEYFGKGEMSYSDFVSKYCQITGKSEPTAKRVHKRLKVAGLIEECEGGYCLPPEEHEEVEETDTVNPTADSLGLF